MRKKTRERSERREEDFFGQILSVGVMIIASMRGMLDQ